MRSRFVTVMLVIMFIVLMGINLFYAFEKKEKALINTYETIITSFEETIEDERNKVESLEEELSVTKTKVMVLEKRIKEMKGLESWNRAEGLVTAYSPHDDQNGISSEGDPSTTSIGMSAGYGIFAVDPKRIPYRSSIRIVYADGHIEEGIAGDTGGALRSYEGYQVDVYRGNFGEAMDFGRRTAEIYWLPPGE